MTYPLDHTRGFAMLPRDAASFEPLIQDHGALAVYLVLMCRARSTPRMARGSHGVVELQAGQCVAGTRELAEAVGLAHSTARRALDRLESLGLIERAATQRGAVITMRDYGDFSDAQAQRGTAPAQLRHRVEHSSGTGSSTAPAPNDREYGIGDREIDPEQPLTPSGTLRADGPALVSPPVHEPVDCHESAQAAPYAPELFPVDQRTTPAKKRRTGSRSGASEEERGKASGLAFALVDELQAGTGRRFHPRAEYVLDMALVLVRKGHTAHEARLVARAKIEQWHGDPEKAQYLSPSTLLRPKNFPRYLAEDVPRIGTLGRRVDRSVSSAEALALDRHSTEFDV